MKEIRVRFAPSPTGYLHVGGLRTALYNYLFARKNQGTFVLRIEDTDQKRFVEGAMEDLVNTLKICGIDNDEGPENEGVYGPYIQSKRQQLYHEHTEMLLKNGHAYKCFCTPERLDTMREQQQAEGRPIVYDGHCRHLSDAEIRSQEASGNAFTIRLKVPQNETLRFSDAVRGDVEFDLSLIDDQILLKSDGFPTYHLANVVDDHLMKISHVIRGEEWLPSTPKHILLYESFGWEVPQFAHLPLLLNSDRSKLSKRQGDVAVEDYLKKGYLPEALLNFVALLGWNPGGDQEIFSLNEMAELFTLDKVNKSGAVFDMEKLRWMNGQYIRQIEEETYVNLVSPYITESLMGIYDPVNIRKIALVIREKIETLAEARDHLSAFSEEHVTISDEEAIELAGLDTSKTVFAAFIDKLSQRKTFDASAFKEIMKSIQKETGIKGKFLFMPMRIALTGEMHGPDLALTAEIFGKEKTIERLRKQL